MLEATTPRQSTKVVPTSTFAAQMGVDEKGALKAEIVEDVVRRGSVV
jgi:hypothetical protein